ncbi:hypothetical protein ASF60_04310 [Methylobacterium sp. Leaf113]|uniref:calcium-binding protein n=1 Tax=Methylobacterium sp. Leaf113 TaxID=1736259 RepID=UPI00070099BF|nr:calcium-binding protein [Methylobacterium sp. Leaf113]KQP91046.1 hypothetical protein ASF60_04310 [Methylobacterium sp. Leaf113]
MATINGDGGNNFLNGTEEEDVINGLGGNDTIDSIDRPENIFAGSINPRRDLVNAGTGDDFVTGGKLDQLDGGEGNDFLLLNFNFNGPVAGSAQPISLTLDADGTGTASDGTFITGFESVNFNLSDIGNNVVNTGNVQAQITGGNGNDTLTTGSSDDFVFGGGGNNIISTGSGNDTISAGSGNDTVLGGDGDDTFGVNVYTDGSDQVNLGAGNDTVRFDRFDGGTGNVRLTFTSAEVGNGNTNDGGSAANQDGGLAVRVQAEDADGNLTGAVSRYDDEGMTFVAGTQGVTFDVRDLVSGAARGNTFEGVVLGTNGNDALTFFPPFRAGQDFYYNAGQGDDTITAGAGNDFLVGGLGNDQMFGGGGNDTYIVDSLRDVVTEADSGGTDTILTGLGRYVLAANVENLTYTGQGNFTAVGNDLDNRVTGGGGNDIIRSGAGSDTIIGNGGDDTLDGGTGIDTMVGGAGNDAYIVDNVGDVVDETGATGIDSVGSSVSYTLGTNVENMSLIGMGAINGTGNELDNRVLGNDAANVLVGGGGNDQLIGAGGDDTLRGGTGNDSLSGGSGNDIIAGDAGNDVITGGLGADRQGGGAGDDTFVIDFGDLAIRGATDLIVDFQGAGQAGGDVIRFSGFAADSTLELVGTSGNARVYEVQDGAGVSEGQLLISAGGTLGQVLTTSDYAFA